VQDRRTLSSRENRRDAMIDNDLIYGLIITEVPTVEELKAELELVLDRLKNMPNMPETEEKTT
jgi:hypothetical protein